MTSRDSIQVNKSRAELDINKTSFCFYCHLKAKELANTPISRLGQSFIWHIIQVGLSSLDGYSLTVKWASIRYIVRGGLSY